MATMTSSVAVFESLPSVVSADSQTIGGHLDDLKLEDSGTYDSESPSMSIDKSTSEASDPIRPTTSTGTTSESIQESSTTASSFGDDKHIYANIREMQEMAKKEIPPTPDPGEKPRRNLHNGWMEYETLEGRTYFYNSDTGKSQWIPPRFLRTPAQVQELLKATKDEVDERFSTVTLPTLPLPDLEGEAQREKENKPEEVKLPQRKVSDARDEIERKVEIHTSEVAMVIPLQKELRLNDDLPEAPTATAPVGTFSPHRHAPPAPNNGSTSSAVAAAPPEEQAPPPPKAAIAHGDRPGTIDLPEYLPKPGSSATSEFSSNDGNKEKDEAVVSPSLLSSFHANASEINSIFSSGHDQGMSTSTRVHHSHANSPPTNRSLGTKNRAGSLKNVPLPQVLPTTSGGFQMNDPYCLDRPIQRLEGHDECSESSSGGGSGERRGSSGESRDTNKMIKCGNMERLEAGELANRTKRREWTDTYMYLTSAHLILYKDEKSAEKHGKHYAPPLCVWELRGASVSWNVEKDRKKKKVVQLELCSGHRYLLRTNGDTETQEWFDALRDVVARLPSAAHPLQPAVFDPSCAVVRNPSALSQRPLSSSAIANKSKPRKSDVMAQSTIEHYSAAPGEEPRPSRESILEKLKRFFRTRPTVELLKERGIYKPEPVFGSTLAAICQLECSLVPKFIRAVTELIEEKGLDVDGLYRVSGNLSAVQRIRCQVDQDKYTSLVNEEDVHVLTGALKLFFRELAEPVFPLSTTKDYLTAIKLSTPKLKLKRLDELLRQLPVENRETLKWLVQHLHRVASHSDKNRMQSHNLAIMFGPTLFSCGEEKTPKKKDIGKKKKDGKKEEAAPVQSNSHMAFTMIMQGQIVEFLLDNCGKFEVLQAPMQAYPGT